MAKILMIISPERFRDEELFVTQAELVSAGHTTTIASTKTGTCPGSRGGFAEAEITLDEVVCKEYDAVVVVGGGGSKILFENQKALAIINDIHDQGKVVAAICLAPVLLANAGVLKGVKATVAGTESALIVEKGATYTGPGVIADGNIVTANGPKSSLAFAQKINAILRK